MYETEKIWREKAGGRVGGGPGIGGTTLWVLRTGLFMALGLAFLVWFVGFRDGVPDLGPSTALLGSDNPGDEAGSGDGQDRELVLRKRSDGHFHLTVHINGVAVPFLVDTGASDVALAPAAARKVGINLKALNYSRRYQTANGIIRAAPVALRDVRVGQLRLYDIPGSVPERPMAISLLGMSFLSALNGYEVRGDRMILRW